MNFNIHKPFSFVYSQASVPFGSIQLSPNTDTHFAVNGQYTGHIYKYCAGKQYEDLTILCFNHTHISGMVHSDLIEFLPIPMQG